MLITPGFAQSPIIISRRDDNDRRISNSSGRGKLEFIFDIYNEQILFMCRKEAVLQYRGIKYWWLYARYLIAIAMNNWGIMTYLI